MRFAGGVQSLIDAIAETIPFGAIELKTKNTGKSHTQDKGGMVRLETGLADGTRTKVSARNVILALPPRIIARHMEFSPALPTNLVTALLNKPTWMAGQAKIVVMYDRPFWRELGLSGFVTSWAGLLQEIHDASPQTAGGALFGFLGIPAKIRREMEEDDLIALIIDQLVRLFGTSAYNYLFVLFTCILEWIHLKLHVQLTEVSLPDGRQIADLSLYQ
ncbi:FAD-dependent oxidoreductase [Gracilibacillus alcaliphilus]|uniref:FAD-dependent oxidoreductase n=1 Tax=Gracilibacillus alcaliphilus TaxID=1401441 RepID=UPI001EF8DC40|nr:FAD-dependent oxidoreductase [Gracilibacillus alcaliphilus]MBM7676886.1 monoamine oxidase [Gracilibacillus alcaliphilus]